MPIDPGGHGLAFVVSIEAYADEAASGSCRFGGAANSAAV
jgi:hypothetical protein